MLWGNGFGWSAIEALQMWLQGLSTIICPIDEPGGMQNCYSYFPFVLCFTLLSFLNLQMCLVLASHNGNGWKGQHRGSLPSLLFNLLQKKLWEWLQTVTGFISFGSLTIWCMFNCVLMLRIGSAEQVVGWNQFRTERETTEGKA